MKRTDQKDDGEEVVTKVAEALNVKLNPSWILESTSTRKKKEVPKAKPRPTILCFASYRKKLEFMYKKSVLKLHLNFNSVYLLEDLTPLRAKILNM